MTVLLFTPWWVYVLFVFLILVGLRATKPRTLSLVQLLVLPTIFCLWNLVWLGERVEGHFSLFTYWAAGIVLGSFLGWKSVRKWVIHANKTRMLLSLPPTWSTLVLIIFIFVVRYFFIYQYVLHEETIRLQIADSSISGVITGIFIGRTLHLFHKYNQAIS